MMKFYDCSSAPNPRRARMFIAEKGLEIPTVDIDIAAGENQAPAYLEINPRGLLPTLELDDGTRFDEVMSICRYLEELHPEPALLGHTAAERAQIGSLQRQMEFDGMIATSEVFRNQHPKFAKRSIPGGGAAEINAIPELIERGTGTVGRFFVKLENLLNQGEFLFGDAFTMVDITAVCAIDFAAWVKIGIPQENAKTKAWYERVSSRPSAKV